MVPTALIMGPRGTRHRRRSLVKTAVAMAEVNLVRGRGYSRCALKQTIPSRYNTTCRLKIGSMDKMGCPCARGIFLGTEFSDAVHRILRIRACTSDIGEAGTCV